MRLLYTKGDGSLDWTEDLLDAQIPPYAILSHTWGEQEVTYKDLQSCGNIGVFAEQLEEGCRKIKFCAEQAQRDGLCHFWIDTCCIDKSNSQELQEAINSMFRWYQKAEKCYVYLSDVKQGVLDTEGEYAFRGSRWFTRGWTLQELLAPQTVEFYSKEGINLGTKQSLKNIIHEITNVPVQALSGDNLSDFGVDDRFSWAQKRLTTREEDKSYCLLGIFGVCLPLIYGEGDESALYRLREVIDSKFHSGRVQQREEKLRKDVLKWLSAPDPSTNYHKAQKMRQADTGLWLLQHARYLAWKTRAASRLWLYGIPGSGKTILSSTVVENLLQHCNDNAGMAIVYFYFDFNDARKQDPELMLRSLLSQLLQASSKLPKNINTLYSACEDGQQQPALHSLLQATPQVIQHFTHVYVVLDALDECTKRQELMDLLEMVAEWQHKNVHLLMTSRKERDIETSLENYVEERDSICLQSHIVDDDIKRYVRQRLFQDKALAKWNKDAAVREEIEDTLMRGARGMFRWIVCQLDALTRCRNRAMLRKSLVTLPQTLDQTYERILAAICEEDRDYAIRILQWLTFSERPLTVEEIAEVVAIDVTRDPAFDSDEILEDPLEALNICSSLVTITTQEATDARPIRRIIGLAHYSVQEYLVSDRIKQGHVKQYSMSRIECHNLITKGSLMYLLQLQQPVSADDLESFALAEYAAKFWHSHLEAGGEAAEQGLLALRVMSMDNPAYITWLQLADSRNWDSWRKKVVTTPLHFAAFYGLIAATRLLLLNGADVDSHGGIYDGSALHEAINGDCVQIVNMLLDKGADINAQSKHYGTALRLAISSGKEDIFKVLLERGADPNALFCQYRSIVLQEAASKGHMQIVKILLDRGVDPNTRSDWHFYGTALQEASAQGHENIVRILLCGGADVNAGGKFETSPLINGSGERRHTDEFNSALHAASANGHYRIVKMLLDAGAQRHQQDGPVPALEDFSDEASHF
ncbi:hypothetical protein B5807_03446 [Epicoccum nigrum]|uniref:Uncharacterized protein n=1 Tax=Epicoccum nigrum TaxID=105696 RepID=A0A1Y2M742_EPING|nr:hypothetical protein B5807_03446 [Epicoccum nigrum]